MSNRAYEQSMGVGTIMREHIQKQQRSRDPSLNRDNNNQPSSKKQPPPTKPKPTTGSKTRSRNDPYANGNAKEQDPIDVYCRIRPPQVTDVVCASIPAAPPNSVRLTDPKKEYNQGLDYTFKQVFCEEAQQSVVFQEVAKPLIKDVVDGKNCLLFTYGVTGSGKTYTMSGSPSEPGIVPRTLDVLFNSIRDNRAMECTFRPDGANRFAIRSGPEAIAERHQIRIANSNGCTSNPTTPVLKRKQLADASEWRSWENRKKETEFVELKEKNYGFSVFVSYIEIYNSYVYDLLDDSQGLIAGQPQSKGQYREDKSGAVFVPGLKEVEVSSSNDALKLFIEGSRRRQTASHQMNKESSRSHAIFNIRVVQARSDPNGEVYPGENNPPIVSQLSLVDLAGSENAKKTNADQKTLKQAGNINKSLDELKRMIRTMRDNQKNGKNTPLNYRNDKLTHLFKTNFEGDGKIRIIMCINPCREYYEDTKRVLEFAVESQEVMINKGFDGYRHRANLFNGDDGGHSGLIFATIGNNFISPLPTSNFLDPNDEKAIPDWIEALESRKQARESKLVDLSNIFSSFRQKVAKIEQENLSWPTQKKQLEMDLNAREAQVRQLTDENNKWRSESEFHQRKVVQLEQNIRSKDRSIQSLESQLKVKDVEADKREAKFDAHVVKLQQKIKNHYEQQLQQIVNRLRSENCLITEKMNLVKEIFDCDRGSIDLLRENVLASRSTNSPPPNGTYPSHSEGGSSSAAPKAPSTPTSSPSKKRSSRRPPASEDNLKRSRRSRHGSSSILPMDIDDVNEHESHPPSFNPRHKRSLSTGNDKWIDHRPPGTLDLGTVFQPKIKNKTSMSNLKRASADTFKRASNYALTHHEADANGDVETRVYKADVIPSLGGGAHVIFNDVETLRQRDPAMPADPYR